MGAISQQTSPLPSESLSYPSPTQDPVAPPKRVVVGRTLALRLHLRPYLTPASKNQVQPSSGCRQGAISLQTSPLPSESLSYPSPTQDPVAPPKQVVIGRMAALRLRLCYCLTTACKNQVQPSLGCRQGGDFTTNLATALGLSSLPVAHPRPRCSTKTSRRRTYSSATAPSSSVPNTCKQKNRFNPARGADMGAISQQTSPLPSESLSYPSLTQDPVAPPKQVVVGRTAALRLRLCYCLITASKNQVEPSLGCRQGGDLTTNLATALGLSSLPVAHPRPRRSTETSRRRT
jgi:hypothetical protein